MNWTKPKTLSVVINTCNRAKSLDKTIQSLLQQGADCLEIVVVNGPSTDETETVLESYKNLIKIFKCNEFNLSVSRNIGIAASCGDVVAFIDDDAFPEPMWVDKILGAYTSEDIGGVGGFVFDHTGTDYQTKYIICDRFGAAWPRETFNPSDLYSFPNSLKYSALIGTNCSFRRDLLLSIGGFDEEYEYFLDETDVCIRVIDAGYKIAQLDDAYVHHKFLPSHMRTVSKATIHHYPILKNSLYFALKYAGPVHGVSAALTHGDNVYKAHLSDANWFVANGQLPAEKLTGLPSVYDRAKKDALDRYQQGSAKHISAKTLSEYSSSFLSTPQLLPEANKLCIVLTCRQYDSIDSGIARFVQVQARALAKLGHTVHTLTLGENISTVDWEQGVWVHRIVAKWYDDQPTDLNFKVHPSQWCYSRTMLDEIREINRRHRVDIIEAPIWDNEAIAFVVAREFPVVVSLQTSIGIALESHPEWESDLKYMNDFIYPSINSENYILNNCDQIRGISEAIVDKIELRNNIAIARHRVTICHLGLEDRTGPDSILQKNNQNIFFLGRLEYRKGIDVLLSAIPLILKEIPSAKFFIAGDDSLLDTTTGLSYKNGFLKSQSAVLEKVVFLGKISDYDADLLFRDAAIFVAPSRFESFGLIYVESMMFGIPTVGCRTGGVAEVIEHGVSGLLVEPGNVFELASTVVLLMKNSSLRAKLGSAGRRRYLEKFTPGSIANQVVAMYNSTIRGAPEKSCGLLC